MARDGGEIRIKIGGDSSELEAEAERAARALSGVGGSAKTAAKGVDKASAKMAQDARRMGKLTEGAENTKDEFGELSSSAAALASALDVVDPRLGAAARGLGDMAGAAEGAIRVTKLQGGALTLLLNPALLAVAAAVAVVGGAYMALSKAVGAANDKLDAAEERLNATLSRLTSIKAMTLELAVAQGTANEVDTKRQQLMAAINAEYQEQLTNQIAAVQAAKSEFKEAIIGKREKLHAVRARQAELDQTKNLIEVKKRAVLQLLENKEGEKKHTAAVKAGTAAAKEAADAESARVETIDAQTEAIAAQTEALITAQLQARAIREGLHEELTALQEINAEQKTLIDTRSEAFKAEMEALNQLTEAGEEAHSRELIAIETFEADKQAIREFYSTQRRQLAETDAEEEQKKQDETRRQFDDDLMVISGSLIDMATTRADALAELGEEATEGQKIRARMMFEVAKSAAIAEAIINATLTASRAFKDYPFPASLAIAASAGAAAYATVSTLQAQEPPSFERGGMVQGSGMVPINAHGGEGILTAKTTASLGGGSSIQALNDGNIVGQLNSLIAATNNVASVIQAQPIVVEIRYNHQAFDRFIMDNLKRPKSPLREYIGNKSKTAARSGGQRS